MFNVYIYLFPVFASFLYSSNMSFSVFWKDRKYDKLEEDTEQRDCWVRRGQERKWEDRVVISRMGGSKAEAKTGRKEEEGKRMGESNWRKISGGVKLVYDTFCVLRGGCGTLPAVKGGGSGTFHKADKN